MNEILFTTKYPDRVLARGRAHEHRFATNTREAGPRGVRGERRGTNWTPDTGLIRQLSSAQYLSIVNRVKLRVTESISRVRSPHDAIARRIDTITNSRDADSRRRASIEESVLSERIIGIRDIPAVSSSKSCPVINLSPVIVPVDSEHVSRMM